MRFESVIWAVLALLLAGSAPWNDPSSLQPLQTDEQYEARDGGSTVPPTGP